MVHYDKITSPSYKAIPYRNWYLNWHAYNHEAYNFGQPQNGYSAQQGVWDFDQGACTMWSHTISRASSRVARSGSTNSPSASTLGRVNVRAFNSAMDICSISGILSSCCSDSCFCAGNKTVGATLAADTSGASI